MAIVEIGPWKTGYDTDVFSTANCIICFTHNNLCAIELQIFNGTFIAISKKAMIVCSGLVYNIHVLNGLILSIDVAFIRCSRISHRCPVAFDWSVAIRGYAFCGEGNVIAKLQVHNIVGQVFCSHFCPFVEADGIVSGDGLAVIAYKIRGCQSIRTLTYFVHLAYSQFHFRKRSGVIIIAVNVFHSDMPVLNLSSSRRNGKINCQLTIAVEWKYAIPIGRSRVFHLCYGA